MTWTSDELAKVGNAEELRVASYRTDGTLRPYVTIWAVRAGDDLYVRSAYGAGNGWFRRATASGTGRIQAGGVERDVTFTTVDPGAQPGIDEAYHRKYDRYGPAIVGSVTGPQVPAVTLRLLPTT
ncbi:DUF2255 family protein [Actinoplanes couchii]|uniref:DUF2255 family protein n=1 Tax=Actinoplanes couchii TaxID=403638 RepID=A0ABQ3XM09_9ACTN|nr:DUF2255 family protein [Actinoplanes couchii]MDR6319246.1 hypothetical protein [Actinoplanes couchii]GID59545.1 hypothetical protein Aco03nite_079490 [Actinoplanes couchii]